MKKLSHKQLKQLNTQSASTPNGPVPGQIKITGSRIRQLMNILEALSRCDAIIMKANGDPIDLNSVVDDALAEKADQLLDLLTDLRNAAGGN